MKFTKYSSIENSYKEKLINQIIEQGYADKQYVVQSKLDGANFSFICNNLDVRVASRTQLVDETFFNCSSVIDKYSNDIIQLFDLINTENKIEQIQLYGELIGNGINNRVKYCNGREFVAFDLLIEYKELIINNTKNVYLNYNKLKQYISNTNILLTPEHFIGNLQECLDYCTDNIIFNTLIPKLLDNEYKKLDINYEEGYVIKPLDYLQLRTGDRVILKCKSPEFAEVKFQKQKKDRFEILTEEEQLILNNLTNYITESRVYSVISKVGEVTSNDFGKILGLYIKDVLEDYSKEHELSKLNKKLNNHLNKQTASCIRSIWTKIC